MTRMAQILALLASLVLFAALAPAASAATSDAYRGGSLDRAGIRHGSVDPVAYKIRSLQPAGSRHWSLEPAGIRYGSVTPNPFRIKAKPQRRHFR